jgi:hypothetical protein
MLPEPSAATTNEYRPGAISTVSGSGVSGSVSATGTARAS